MFIYHYKIDEKSDSYWKKLKKVYVYSGGAIIRARV